jgi:hypothetical protein
MFIYAISNKTNNVNIFYSSTLAESCIEFNKYYSFDTHCIKKYQLQYDNNINREDYEFILHACGNPEFSLKRDDDDIDKGYTTTTARHTNSKFGKHYEFHRSG